ncbi:membrane-associated tyrosine- and threonine-specific cdc2-inhibitory kinase [Rhea pennata]|uniref:membrane-associated tyrosine- and threonine-specific cdc2-inhibitory kinase n=1 Tax=Rhea pennata TaxID=8795 RepID=UPI002E2774AD
MVLLLPAVPVQPPPTVLPLAPPLVVPPPPARAPLVPLQPLPAVPPPPGPSRGLRNPSGTPKSTQRRQLRPRPPVVTAGRQGAEPEPGPAPAAPPPASRLYDPRRPQTFFRQCFQVLGRLGRGSHGEVYKVRSREDGRLYAVKRTLEPYRGAADRRRKLAEVRKHERVGRHPHCLGLVRAWEEKGQLYLQSELCPGGPLRRPARGGLAPWRAAAYLWDLLQALGHLHARRLAHLDVKPANVLLAPGGCRLGDFGCLLEPGGRVGDGAEGDPRYLAPEALRGDLGPAADVFSLGLTLLELAAGRELPAAGDGWQELRRGRLPAALAAGLSPELRTLVVAMLEPEPGRRPSVETLLRTALMRRAGRWRAFTRLADEALRRAGQLLQDIRALLRWLWGALWGPARWLRAPVTPPHSPLSPRFSPASDWDEDEEDDDDDDGGPTRWAQSAPGRQGGAWADSPRGSPTSFSRHGRAPSPGAASTPRRAGAPQSGSGSRSPESSPGSLATLRRTLTFEEEPDSPL